MEQLKISYPEEEVYKKFNQEQLKCVKDFTVENCYGRIKFLEAVDLRDIIISNILSIEQDTIEVYKYIFI